MASGRRYRIDPGKGAKGLLLSWMGAYRFCWNAKWAERAMWRSLSKLDARNYPDHRDWPAQDAAYAWIGKSEETAWLGDIPSEVKRNAAAEFVTASNRHLRGLAKEPRPKRADSKRSVWLTRELFDLVEGPQGGMSLVLVRGKARKALCSIPLRLSRGFEMPASVRVSVDGGAWFVSFSSGGAEEDAYPETAAEQSPESQGSPAAPKKRESSCSRAR